jgi:hypothetical protein
MAEEPVGFLLSAIQHAEKQWAGNPQFRAIMFKLQQIRMELDTINQQAANAPQPRQEAATRSLGG